MVQARFAGASAGQGEPNRGMRRVEWLAGQVKVWVTRADIFCATVRQRAALLACTKWAMRP